MAGREGESEAEGTGPRACEPTIATRGVGASRPLPLNSKRLSTVLLRQLSRRLGLPVAAAPDEMRVLIEGKLDELGREPGNVQVTLEDVAHGTRGFRTTKGCFWTSSLKRWSLALHKRVEAKQARRRKVNILMSL